MLLKEEFTYAKQCALLRVLMGEIGFHVYDGVQFAYEFCNIQNDSLLKKLNDKRGGSFTPLDKIYCDIALIVFDKVKDNNTLIDGIHTHYKTRYPELYKKICFFEETENLREYIKYNAHTKEPYLSVSNFLAYCSEIMNEKGMLDLTYESVCDTAAIYCEIDKNIFFQNPIVFNTGEEIFSSKYYSIKPGFDPRSHSVTQGRWSSFFQAAQKGSLLCSFALDYQIAYWEKQMSLIDYVLIDYFYGLAYEELPECRELLDSVPVNNQKVEGLRPLLNTVWSPSVLADLTADTTFFKLTWKHSFKKTASGSETVYGHLVKDIVN